MSKVYCRRIAVPILITEFSQVFIYAIDEYVIFGHFSSRLAT